jgi:oligoribonuclease NrnB/cAMP/cGMP phosphodiesterase (DHH superfamily)
MIIVYHRKDNDGFCSAAIIRKKYPDAEFIGWNYGDECKQFLDFIDEEIIVVDISFPMNIMYNIASRNKLTWIDHHASKIADYIAFEHSFDNNINVVLEVGRAACELTWEYIFPDKMMPASVEYLGMYDTWRGYGSDEWNHNTLPFEYGMRSICSSLETFPKFILNYDEDGAIDSIINNGRIVIGYQNVVDSKLCSANSFIRSFKGYRALCLNVPYIDSNTMQSVFNASEHDLMLSFVYTGKHWSCSLRSVGDLDVSAIAKSMGGGGHKNAAGFEVKSFEDIFD